MNLLHHLPEPDRDRILDEVFTIFGPLATNEQVMMVSITYLMRQIRSLEDQVKRKK